MLIPLPQKEDMEERYSRNRLYVTKEEQDAIKNVRIFLGGAGIGSIIAECALRFGFENITIVDGDRVEESNLNRQNYVKSDIGKFKAETLKKRLLKINPTAKITYYNVYITKDNVYELLKDHDIAINALDFKNELPFVFDKLCSDMQIPVLHPYNFGWAGFLTIVKPNGYQLTEISEDYKNFELSMARYILRHFQFWNIPIEWFQDIINKYGTESGTLPPPQLSIGSWLAASHCVNAMFNIATGREVRTFPKFYMSTILEEVHHQYQRLSNNL